MWRMATRLNTTDLKACQTKGSTDLIDTKKVENRKKRVDKLQNLGNSMFLVPF
jgi:hypothetical protein